MKAKALRFLPAMLVAGALLWGFAWSGLRPGPPTSLAATQAAGAPAGQSRTSAEESAGVTPTNYAWPELNVLRYGDNKSPGNTDMTSAFRAALAVAAKYEGGAEIDVPRGDYLITSTLTMDQDYLHLRGSGMGSTRLIFAPDRDATLLELGGTRQERYLGSVSDLTLYSRDPKYTKIGIDIIDVSGWDIRDVSVQGSITSGRAHYWSGRGSIGIRVRGREVTRLGPLYIYADKPIQISDNPSNSIDIDHFHFQDNLLVGNGYPIVTIDSGVNLTNVTFDGYQAWVKGTHGLYWVDKTTSQTSLRLALRNVRWEQGSSASDYLVRIEHNYALQGLTIENCFGGADRNGFMLRKVTNVNIADTYYIGQNGLTALDVDDSVKRISLVNDFWQTGGSAKVVGQRKVFESGASQHGAPLPTFAYYEEGGSAGK
jgi:Pectate lyase superfamily protein